VVVLSTFTAQAPEAYAFADACRARGLRVAIGGLHVSVRPDEAARHADHVFLGEGEATWPAFLADLARGAARPRYDARGLAFPLADAPLPRYDLLDVDRYNRITIQTTRSCPHRCDFCASGILLRGPYRKKPLDLVRRDLDAIGARWPRPFIEFADDNTFVDKRWGKALLRALVPYRLKWFTESDVTLADDPELLDLLAASGCRQVLIGFEDVDAQAVAGLEGTAFGHTAFRHTAFEARSFKARRVADYARAVRVIQEAGVSVNGTFIVGADEHTPAVFGRIARFAEDVGLAEVQVTVLTPFPGTPLRDRLERQGRLLAEDDWACCTLFDATFVPARMTVRELEEGLMQVFRDLYAPARVRARRRRFREHVRAGRRRASDRGRRISARSATRTSGVRTRRTLAATVTSSGPARPPGEGRGARDPGNQVSAGAPSPGKGSSEYVR
jgi:radical SAM superfamily enzyme YgiQ (UPF0313 family)